MSNETLTFDSKVITSMIHKKQIGEEVRKDVKSVIFMNVGEEPKLAELLADIGMVVWDINDTKEIIMAAKADKDFRDALLVAVRGGLWWDWLSFAPPGAEKFVKLMGLDFTKQSIVGYDCRGLANTVLIWHILLAAGTFYSDAIVPSVVCGQLVTCSNEVVKWWKDLSAVDQPSSA